MELVESPEEEREGKQKKKKKKEGEREREKKKKKKKKLVMDTEARVTTPLMKPKGKKDEKEYHKVLDLSS